MSDEVKLLPCPFCGGRANSPDQMGPNEWDVECYCGAGIIACGPNAGSMAEAIAAWNTRAIEATRPTDMEVRDVKE